MSGKRKRLGYSESHHFSISSVCPTLKQTLLLPAGVHPGGQLKGMVVGGTVVTGTPSAGFLQMYFSLLLQLTTSHSPAKTPVVMATHPWFRSFGERGQRNANHYNQGRCHGVSTEIQSEYLVGLHEGFELICFNICTKVNCSEGRW